MLNFTTESLALRYLPSYIGNIIRLYQCMIEAGIKNSPIRPEYLSLRYGSSKLFPDVPWLSVLVSSKSQSCQLLIHILTGTPSTPTVENGYFHQQLFVPAFMSKNSLTDVFSFFQFSSHWQGDGIGHRLAELHYKV